MKFKDLPKTGRGGRELKMENGTIEKATLTAADHGVLSAWLMLQFDGSGCGFGGFVLAKVGQDNLQADKNWAGEFIVRCLAVGGVDEWSDLRGQNVRALTEGLGGGVVAIGHIIKDEWFCPGLEWKKD